MTTRTEIYQSLLNEVAQGARHAGVFGNVSVRDGRLVCTAKDSAAPASYRIELDSDRLWVSLVTADRWLSESIEADLMHTGDDLADLLEEELVDQGVTGATPTFEHFRSDDMLFTFRTPLPDKDVTATTTLRWLLAYEACFRRLGDMSAGDDEA